MAVIVVIDDDPIVCKMICKTLQDKDYECHTAYTLSQGMEVVRQSLPDLIFLDLSMPDGNGLTWMDAYMETPSSPEVIIITSTGSEKSLEEAISKGAWDFIQKPVSVRMLHHLVHQTLRYRKDKGTGKERVALKLPGIVGESQSLHRCLQEVAQAASSSAPCLIHGETGVGKELIARAIHANSDRHGWPFVAVDCASLTESLAGSTLFGHRKGAFTGAHTDKSGLIESAAGGVLFLDEIGELPLDIQKNLLRVLQEQRFRPVGALQEKRSDFRLISATHRDLNAMTEKNAFREDLLYRVMGQKVFVPPLRHRLDDLNILAGYFLQNICKQYEMPTKGFSPDFIPALRAYDWPGNIRELIHCLENTVAASREKPILYPQDLPPHIRIRIRSGQFAARSDSTAAGTSPVMMDELPNAPAVSADEWPKIRDVRKQAMDMAEKAYLEKLLEMSADSIKELCRKAGLSRPHFYALLRKHDLPPPKKGAGQ